MVSEQKPIRSAISILAFGVVSGTDNLHDDQIVP